jgi:flagellar basal-body rod protein FlgG
MKTSATGMIAQQRAIEVIANNLANVNTTGFKRSRVYFQDILYETIQDSRLGEARSTENVGPVQFGRGVRVGAVSRLHAQGAIEVTDRPLDVAIEGAGFLQIQRPDLTTAYTRDGGLTLSDTGALVTTDGYAVLPGILVPQDATSISIASSGLVTVTSDGSTEPMEVGRLELARFINPSGLLSIGENQYLETPASGQPIIGYPEENGFGSLLSGALESSNVEIVQEMTDMIEAQRAFEINARAIQASDEMAKQTSELIR